MKNLFIIALAILTLSGCRSLGFYGSYTYSFVGVSDYNQSDTVVVQGNSYSDSLITMKWDLTGSRFRFDLANETNENIEIDWRKVSLIAPTQYAVRSAVEFNSFLPPKTTLSQWMRFERFVPAQLSHADRYNYNIWFTNRIIEIRPTYYIGVRDMWAGVLGTQFAVYFPLKIKGKEYHYKFIFEADRLHVRQQKPDARYSIRKGEDFPEGYRTLEEIKNGHKGRIRVEKEPPVR